MPEGFVQMNINLTDDDARKVDHMAREDAYENRSAFMRRLIRQEWLRRYSQPNQATAIEQAEKL